MRRSAGKVSGADVCKTDSLGRRSFSLEHRQRIVAEAVAPGASVAQVARRHGLNANLLFKWIKRAREGWLDRRQVGKDDEPKRAEPMRFVPVTIIDGNAAASLPAPGGAPRIEPSPIPTRTRSARKEAKRRSVIEIAFPDGARISVDAEVDEAALRAVLSAMKDRR